MLQTYKTDADKIYVGDAKFIQYQQFVEYEVWTVIMAKELTDVRFINYEIENINHDVNTTLSHFLCITHFVCYTFFGSTLSVCPTCCVSHILCVPLSLCYNFSVPHIMCFMFYQGLNLNIFTISALPLYTTMFVRRALGLQKFSRLRCRPH